MSKGLRENTPRLWDIVQIDWLDSMHTSGWLKWEDITWGQQKCLQHKTVGYLAAQDKVSVTVIQSFQDHWQDGHPANIDAVMTIPRSAITTILILARSKRD